MVIIPTLETDRLRLRPPRLSDFADYAELMGSARATFMGGPFDARAAWGMFSHDVACWELFGHGGLMIDLRASGECVGQVGINGGPLFPEPELGWLLYEGREGHGYATEAAAALREWALAATKLETLVSYFDPSNARSIAVALRLGAVPDPDAPRQDPDDVVYRHFRRS